MRAWGTGFPALVLCLAALGCHHRQPLARLPVPPPAPVPLETPKPKDPGLVAQVPPEPAPLPEVTPPKKARKPKKKPMPAPAAPVPPVEVASAGPPPAPGAVIGALTAGEDASPQKRQRAAEMIQELEKRVAGLPDVARKQRDGIVRVRNFEREAKKALDSGDAEGAIILATKAKLLLDDLSK